MPVLSQRARPPSGARPVRFMFCFGIFCAAVLFFMTLTGRFSRSRKVHISTDDFIANGWGRVTSPQASSVSHRQDAQLVSDKRTVGSLDPWPWIKPKDGDVSSSVIRDSRSDRSGNSDADSRSSGSSSNSSSGSGGDSRSSSTSVGGSGSIGSGFTGKNNVVGARISRASNNSNSNDSRNNGSGSRSNVIGGDRRHNESDNSVKSINKDDIASPHRVGRFEFNSTLLSDFVYTKNASVQQLKNVSERKLPRQKQGDDKPKDLHEEHAIFAKQPPILTVFTKGGDNVIDTWTSSSSTSSSYPPASLAEASLGDELYSLTKLYALRANASCPRKFDGMNMEFVDKWAKAKQTVCSSSENSSAPSSAVSSSPSSIDCYFKSTSVPMTLCSTANSQIELQMIHADRNFRAGNGAVSKGALKVNCNADKMKSKKTSFPTNTGAWMIDGLVDQQSNVSCSQWVEHPVFFISRWRITNPFHIVEDLTQTFVSLMVARDLLRAHGNSLEIVFADDMAAGPFFPAWEAMFYRNNSTGNSSQIDTKSDLADIKSEKAQSKKKKKKKKRKKPSSTLTTSSQHNDTRSDSASFADFFFSSLRNNNLSSTPFALTGETWTNQSNSGSKSAAAASSLAVASSSLFNATTSSVGNTNFGNGSLNSSSSMFSSVADSLTSLEAAKIRMSANVAALNMYHNTTDSSNDNIQDTANIRYNNNNNNNNNNNDHNGDTSQNNDNNSNNKPERRSGSSSSRKKYENTRPISRPSSNTVLIPDRPSNETFEDSPHGQSEIAIEGHETLYDEPITQSKHEAHQSVAVFGEHNAHANARGSNFGSSHSRDSDSYGSLNDDSVKGSRSSLISRSSSSRSGDSGRNEYSGVNGVGNNDEMNAKNFADLIDMFSSASSDVNSEDKLLSALFRSGRLAPQNMDKTGTGSGVIENDDDSTLTQEERSRTHDVVKPLFTSSAVSSRRLLETKTKTDLGSQVKRKQKTRQRQALYGQSATSSLDASSSSSSSSKQLQRVRQPIAGVIPSPTLMFSDPLPYPPGTCFRRTLHNVHGGVSLLSMFGVGDMFLCRSSILQAFSHRMMESFHLPKPCDRLRTRRESETSNKTSGALVSFAAVCGKDAQLSGDVLPLRITWISRMPFINEPGGKLRQTSHGAMTTDIEMGLFEAINRSLSDVTRPIVFRRVRFELLPLREQLRVASETDILVGMHGAGLTFSMFLPVSASVVEVYTMDRSIQNQHYRNLCYWTHRKYTAIEVDAFDGKSLRLHHLQAIAQSVRASVQAYL